MKTKEDFINLIKERVSKYNINNRGVDVSSRHCVYYNGVTGNKCIVGGAMKEYIAEELGAISMSIGKIRENINEGVKVLRSTIGDAKAEIREPSFQDIFKEEYQGFNLWVWEELQDIHDNHNLWNEKGLNESGEREVKDLISRVENNFEMIINFE
jgi:hypothetical protein